MLVLKNAGKEVEVLFWKFPAGELGVKIKEEISENQVEIECKYQSSDDLIYLLLLVDAIREQNKNVDIHLVIPYFPYARQDRVCASGESFSLRVIASMVASCNFDTVTVHDAHSSVLAAFFKAGVFINVEQHLLLRKFLIGKKDFALVSPDAGATKKIYALAKEFGVPVVEAKKVRSVEDGKIVATSIDNSTLNEYNELVVVDDICDGGMTFIELAKVIREGFSGKLTLVVTHGIFSRGFSELSKYFNEIIYSNDMRKEK